MIESALKESVITLLACYWVMGCVGLMMLILLFGWDENPIYKWYCKKLTLFGQIFFGVLVLPGFLFLATIFIIFAASKGIKNLFIKQSNQNR